MEQLQQAWTGILDFLSKLVIPDWGALIALLPVFVLIGIGLWILLTVRAYAVLGPRQRGVGRLMPAPPAGLHAPGPSFAPAFGAIGAALFFFGLLLGGIGLVLGIGALVLTLLYWLREFMAEYDHAAGPTTTALAIEHAGPPPGVHVPGPTFLPVVSAVGSALLFVGLVLGGWVLLAAVVCLMTALLGWLRAARIEYQLTEEADRTGHLRNAPAPAFPLRLFVFFTLIMLAAVSVQTGIFPPSGGGAGGGAAAASPGTSPSGAPSGAPASSGPTAAPVVADVTIVAQGIQFTTGDVSGPAGKAFTLAFDNQDAGTLHNVHIKNADGSDAFKGDFVTGVATKVYQVPSLPAGAYSFICDVHPSMTGTLTLK